MAAIAVRVGAMGSALDQLRLSLLAALDRVADSLHEPVWLSELEGALDQLAPSQREELRQALAAFGARIERAVAEQAVPAPVLTAVGQLGERLTSVEAATDRFGEDARTLVEWVAPLHDRLAAIAVQVDRVTPLARVGDEIASVLARLDRLNAGLEEVVGHIGGGGLSLPDRAPEVSGEDRRIDAVVEALAAVARRQDEVAAEITTVMDQARGPTGIEAVLDRMEEQERSLAARLDRIDGELRRRRDLPAGPSSGADTRSDDARALRASLGRLEQQVVGGLAGFARRQDELAASVDRRLSAIETGLEALKAGAGPASGPSASAESAALRLAELRAERARVQDQLREERLLAAQPRDDDDLHDQI